MKPIEPRTLEEQRLHYAEVRRRLGLDRVQPQAPAVPKAVPARLEPRQVIRQTIKQQRESRVEQMRRRAQAAAELAALDQVPGRADVVRQIGELAEIVAESALSQPLTPRERLGDIMRRVAADHGISTEDLRGVSREKKVVLARNEFCWQARRTGRYSLPTIGTAVRRDHSTVLHAIRKHAALVGRPVHSTVLDKTGAEA